MGHTYMIGEVLTLPEIVDEEGHLKLHEAIIAVSHEGKRNKTCGWRRDGRRTIC